MPYAEITFDKNQQLALLGHALVDSRFFQTLGYLDVADRWFTEDANAGRAYRLLQKFDETHHRQPTLEELKSSQELNKDDVNISTRVRAAIDAALAAKEKIGISVLLPLVVEWKIAWTARDGIENMMGNWNRGDLQLAIKNLLQLADQVQHLDAEGLTAISKSSADWYDVSVSRQSQIPKRLIQTGLSFIDEPTYGLRPDDLMVIASYTGFGKTQLMTTIAYQIAEQDRLVKMFALEAGDGEIEMRIRFQKMLENKISAGDKTPIDYVAWSRGLNPEMKKFEPDDKEIKKVLKRISITYKKTSKYGIEQLEKDIRQVAKSVDAILVDHLHYIDKGSTKKNETEALSDIVHRVRDVNLNIDRTIIMAAHVKKNQEAKRFHTLLPGLDDIYGSGDISKTATWVLALAQPNTVDTDKFPYDELLRMGFGLPTLVRFLKSRDGGSSRTGYTMVPFFRRSNYSKEYAIGRMDKADTIWLPFPKAKFPGWVKSGVEFMTDKQRELNMANAKTNKAILPAGTKLTGEK